jgi:hypothetical protein
MLSCYFIARADAALEELPVEVVRHRDLVAGVRPLGKGARATPGQMLEYNAVLAAASKRTTVLPMRFGTNFRSEEAVVQLLASRREQLTAALERLDGMVEMTVRVRPPRRADEITQMVRPLESWSEVRVDRSGRKVVELAHLIPRSQAASYRRRLAAEEIEISGPWPPVHFLPQFLRLPVRRATGSGTSRASGAENAAGR